MTKAESAKGGKFFRKHVGWLTSDLDRIFRAKNRGGAEHKLGAAQALEDVAEVAWQVDRCSEHIGGDQGWRSASLPEPSHTLTTVVHSVWGYNISNIAWSILELHKHLRYIGYIRDS
jgi:hypothetical protein